MILGLLSWLMRLLPLQLALGLGRLGAALWYHVVPIRRRVAEKNVARVFGQSLSRTAQRRIVRLSLRHLGMYVIESLRMPSLTAAVSKRRVRRVGIERFEALLAQKKGVVVVTAHLGHFDLAGASQAILGYPIHAVVKDIHWPPAQRFWAKIRRETGLLHIGERNSARHILRALGQGDAVTFLIDQHLPPHRAIACRFFGQWAATTPAPVRFAMKTGAPILPVFMVRGSRPGDHVVHFCEPFRLEFPYSSRAANVLHNTERLNRIVEAWVLRYPEQWLWVHRRWKVEDRPEGWDLREAAEIERSAAGITASRPPTMEKSGPGGAPTSHPTSIV